MQIRIDELGYAELGRVVEFNDWKGVPRKGVYEGLSFYGTASDFYQKDAPLRPTVRLVVDDGFGPYPWNIVPELGTPVTVTDNEEND